MTFPSGECCQREPNRGKSVVMSSRFILSDRIHDARRLLAVLVIAIGAAGFVAQPAVAIGPTSHAYDETGVRDVLSLAAAMPATITSSTTTHAVIRSPRERARAHRTHQRATTAAAL